MPIRDTAARNASLDNDYGTTRGPNAAASHALALFNGDPLVDGVELSGGGYARVTVLAADWAAASDGMKSPTNPQTFPATTAAWPNPATHWALYAGSVMWDCGPLTEPLEVTGPGPGPTVGITVFYDETVVPPEE